MLVPGLGQTADYAHAALSALRVQDREEDLEPWVGLRMRRQAILTRRNPPQLHWILTELGLRQPVGGPKVMSKQIRHLIDLAERPNITINVLPAKVAAHPGLLGQFLIMEFAAVPTVVYVEAKTTGLFLDDPDKVALYRLTARPCSGRGGRAATAATRATASSWRTRPRAVPSGTARTRTAAAWRFPSPA